MCGRCMSMVASMIRSVVIMIEVSSVLVKSSGPSCATSVGSRLDFMRCFVFSGV